MDMNKGQLFKDEIEFKKITFFIENSFLQNTLKFKVITLEASKRTQGQHKKLLLESSCKLTKLKRKKSHDHS